MSKSPSSFEWDVKKLSDAMKITAEDVVNYFTDGRRVSFVLERRLAYEIVHGKLAPSEGAGYDLLDRNGKLWEVRSITNGGLYFTPSNQVGKGRTFQLEGFLDKLNEIEGYILCDIVAFPKIPFWAIPKDTVKKWWDAGLLGKNASISHKRALELINKTIEENGLHSFDK
jgi:hypothetical protein